MTNTNTNTKVTKKMVLAAIVEAVNAGVLDEFVGETYEDLTVEDIAKYAQTTIEQLDAKATKAKERAASKKAEGDALREAVKAQLTKDYQTIADITAAVEAAGVEGVDITSGKVTARLTQLINAEEAHKTNIKVDGRTIKGYALGSEPEPEDENEEEPEDEERSDIEE